MSTNVIQADYATLDSIAARFGQQLEVNSALFSQVQRSFLALSQDGWEGRGSTEFAAEMQGEIFPALQRLNHALGEAQAVTLQIKDVLQDAEEEAARLFGGDGALDGMNWNGNNVPDFIIPELPAPILGVLGATGFGAIALGIRAGASTLGWIVDRGKLSGGLSLLKQEWGKDRKFKPGLGIGYHGSDSFFKGEHADTWNAGGFSGTHKGKWSAMGGGIGIGAKFDEDGLSAGLSGEFYTAKGSVLGVVGDKDLGLTGEAGIEALSAEGLFGIKDNQLGATIGLNLISVEGEVGTNIAGFNVGVKGEVGIKAEFGFELGAEEIEVKLPFASFGLSFGGAK
jgi:WXG100 family type VII secretion target